MGYFALLVDESLDAGMSRPAATFASPCLASAETFVVQTVECWGVAPPDEEDAYGGGKGGTAMERFGEDKVLLELHGKAMHSDGYRGRAEPPIEAD